MKKLPWLNLRSVRGRVGVVGPVRWLVSALSVVLVLVAATIVGTNLVTADPAPGASPITVTFNYNGATGGNSLASETVTPGVSADSALPFPTKSGLDFSGWFNTQSLLNGQRIITIGEGDTGELLAGFVPPELAQTLNLDPPIPVCVAGGPCATGYIGPGGGLVFYDAGSVQVWGQYLEMAPKMWSGSSNDDTPTLKWCSDISTSIAGAVGTAVGTGSANTTAMLALPCTSGAAFSADAYAGGGLNDWFLPSQDELNAMCYYSRNLSASPDPTVSCYGSSGTAQDSPFAAGTYGFASDYYWSSSQYSLSHAWFQGLSDGRQSAAGKFANAHVRPVRSF